VVAVSLDLDYDDADELFYTVIGDPAKDWKQITRLIARWKREDHVDA
jgi:hypothetical protein